MTITQSLSTLSIKDLNRLLNTDKCYLHFKISVSNSGMNTKVNCTDTFKQINRNTWNGYDFFIENDSTMKYYIEQAIINL